MEVESSVGMSGVSYEKIYAEIDVLEPAIYPIGSPVSTVAVSDVPLFTDELIDDPNQEISKFGTVEYTIAAIRYVGVHEMFTKVRMRYFLSDVIATYHHRTWR